MAYYTTKQIFPWLYSIYDPGNGFMYLLVGEKSALLYDTGYGISCLKTAIAEVTALPVEVVIGHGHLDHANGAGQFDFAWIGEDDMELCARHTSRTARRRVLERLEAAGVQLPQGFMAEEYIQKFGANLRKLDAGHVFDLGGLNARAVPLEGHTRGSVGLLIEEHRLLLCSDAINHRTWVFLAESTPIAEYIDMLKRTEQLPFDTFVWGHEDKLYCKNECLHKFVNVAQNIDINKSVPFDFPGRDALLYEENGAGIIFASETKL